MRKTVTQVASEVFRRIKQSQANNVTPNVFKYKKPLNFIGECIVILVPTITSAQFQKGTVHINYHVPNQVDTSVDPIDRSIPDLVKLEDGARIIEDVFEYFCADDYVFELSDTTLIETGTTLIESENSKEYYMNIRVLYRNANI